VSALPLLLPQKQTHPKKTVRPDDGMD
jgi:hypothetical protein